MTINLLVVCIDFQHTLIPPNFPLLSGRSGSSRMRQYLGLGPNCICVQGQTVFVSRAKLYYSRHRTQCLTSCFTKCNAHNATSQGQHYTMHNDVLLITSLHSNTDVQQYTAHNSVLYARHTKLYFSQLGQGGSVTGSPVFAPIEN